MTTRDTKYYVESQQNALKIPDVKTAMEVARLLQINMKGMRLTSKEDFVKVIVSEMNKGINPDIHRVDSSAGLKKAIGEDKKYKFKLLSKYDRVQKLYRQLPDNYKKDLRNVFQDIEEGFEFRKREIKKSECSILIVGETGAGKSSLINLLLGVRDLMPTSQLDCTATIVELRTSDKDTKEAVGYFRSLQEASGRKKRPPVFFDLRTEAGLQQFRSAVTECEEDGNSPYDRIEVTWPFPMLEEGLVIVDTPGIGGGGQMAKYAEKYLAKSYGFIYVVNSANAGGVQKGRLQNFLRLVVNSAGEEGFNSESTIFICNKWEMVPEQDRESVRHSTYEKLSNYFSGLKKSQLHFMSLAEADRGLRLSTFTPEYRTLLDMVERLLPDSIRSRLNVHYRWLTAVLKRIIYILKVSKVVQAKSMEKCKDQFQQVRTQIDKLEQNSKDSIMYLKAAVSAESDMAAQRSREVLQSRSMSDQLMRWRPSDLPREDKKKVAAEALELIGNKVAREMNYWEQDQKLVGRLKEKILSVCKKDFELMEYQITKLEGALLDGDNKIVRDLHRSLKKQAPVKQVWSKAKVRSIDEDTGTVKGLGGAVVNASRLKTSDKQIKKIFSDYRLRDQERCVAKMQEATKVFMESILQGRQLEEQLHKFFSRFVKDIDAVAKMIPDFLKADLDLMETLKHELSDTETNLREVFPMLLQESHILLGQCDIFFVNHIFRFDYSISDLIWNPNDHPIGKGSFADVYLAHVKTSRHGTMPVALKECRDPLKESTVSDILLEDRTLRELDHPNIVRYYGATFRLEKTGHNKGMHWIMIMEVCKYTLKSKFLQADSPNPGKMPAGSSAQLTAMLNIAEYSRQLCSGVKYLHDKGYVHRDLKLENILVTERNSVKLTDVGLTKHVSDIGHSQVGSPVYMAPEVLLMSRNYDYKADIYSLAIIFWEIWYGNDAAVYIHHHIHGSLEASIKTGLRPALTLSTKPPEPWTSLIERSWDYYPENRPSADDLQKFFDDFISKSRRM